LVFVVSSENSGDKKKRREEKSCLFETLSKIVSMSMCVCVSVS